MEKDKAWIKTLVGYSAYFVAPLTSCLCQLYEEKYMKKYNLPPLLVVGISGVYSCAAMSAALWPLYLVRVGGGLGNGPEGRLEDVGEAVTSLVNGNSWLVSFTLLTMVMEVGYDVAATTVKKRLSSTTR